MAMTRNFAARSATWWGWLAASSMRGHLMPRYDVYFFCNECSQTHPLGITVERDLDIADRASIGDTYPGKELPPEIALLRNNATRCPVTRRTTEQRDNNQVFLVRVR